MLTESGSLLQAFQTASGVSAAQLNVFIRTLVLGSTYGWAVWMIYGLMNEIRHEGVEDFIGSFKKISRVLLIIVLITILVFIS